MTIYRLCVQEIDEIVYHYREENWDISICGNCEQILNSSRSNSLRKITLLRTVNQIKQQDQNKGYHSHLQCNRCLAYKLRSNGFFSFNGTSQAVGYTCANCGYPTIEREKT